MKKTIAIVEDEAAIRDNYARGVRARGYSVRAYASRRLALGRPSSRLPDLVVIDISSATSQGRLRGLCRELRARRAADHLALTARDSELDAVSGLRLGTTRPRT